MALKLRLRLLAVLACLPLAACSSLGDFSLGSLTGKRGDYWLKDDAPRFPSDAESLIAYHRYAWSLDTVDWAREGERLRAAATHDSSLPQRLRQAVHAAAPAATPRDHARAQQLFEQYERDAQSDASLHAVVVLLRDELAERRRLEDRVRDEASRADDLDQKLGALKAIELNMLQRSHPAGAKKK